MDKPHPQFLASIKCGLYMDVYGNLSGQSSTNKSATKHFEDLLAGVRALKFLISFFRKKKCTINNQLYSTKVLSIYGGTSQVINAKVQDHCNTSSNTNTLYRNTSDHYNVQATPLIIKTSTKLCCQKSHHDNNAPLIMGLYETIRNIGNF